MAEPVSRPVGNAFEQAIALLDERSLLPTCVVFALDHVLWPFTCGSTVESPDDVALYPHASAVLAALKTRGVRASACSVTAKPSAVQSLLQQLNIADYLSPKVCASCQLPLILKAIYEHHSNLVFCPTKQIVRHAKQIGRQALKQLSWPAAEAEHARDDNRLPEERTAGNRDCIWPDSLR